ncbi:ABC transporter substrate-binding protein [Pseudarthrobacter sp. NPDC058329]|uniref:ABC transporter substrate-binding protein n=1 Tax=Pseudarthrobacter sp. NPDC058329 TaxID=3346448 RepID=UPI0036D75B77
MKKTDLRRLLAAGLTIGAIMTALPACAVQSSSPSGTATPGTLKAVPGFDPAAKTISLGVITALSGPISATASEQIVGQEAYWSAVNAAGGIEGYTVKLVPADNQYNPQLAVQAYQGIKDKSVMLSGILGDASTDALLPILNQSESLAIPSGQSAKFVKEPGLAANFTSYQTNVFNAISHLIEKGEASKDTRFCAMVQDEQSGKARVEALNYAGEKFGFKPGATAHFAPLDASFTAQVQSLKNDGCEVVVFGGAANLTPNLVAAATQLDFKATWIAEFYAIADSFRTSPIADYLSKNFLLTGPGANLDDTSVEGIKNLTSQLKGKPATMQMVYGYIQGITAHAILKKAIELGDLSGDGLRNAVNQLDSVSYQGLQGDVAFGPVESRRLPQTTTLFGYDAAKPYGLSAKEVAYEAPNNNPAF